MSANPRADKDSLNKIQRRERFADFSHTLARVQWDFFTTLTFKNPLPKESVRWSMFWRWARHVSEICEVPHKSLLFALRGEKGEIGARYHWHCLVGGIPACNWINLQYRLVGVWWQISNKAHCDVRLYDRSLAGADYISKCLSGANAYEVNKYSRADEVTLSDSVFKLIRRLDEKGDRHCRIYTRINGRVSNASGNGESIGRLGYNDSSAVSRIKDTIATC